MNPISHLRAAVLIGALLTASCLPAQAPPAESTGGDLPATAAGRLARGLVDAANSTDAQAAERFLDANLSPSARQPRAEILDYLRALREDAGGVTIGASRATASGNAIVELWARRVEAGVEIAVYPDRADSTRLERVAIRKSLRPGAQLRPFPTERMDDVRIVSLVREQLDRMAAADMFSGVVLVARRDTVLLEGAYGWETPNEARMTTRSRFHLASQGKMFTSVAIAQLVQRGRIALDDTVGELLPDHAWTEQARGITIRQLLSHTAGMGTLFDRPAYPMGRIFPTVTDRLPIFAAEPLQFAPGTRYAYSNEGFETLGAIVEKVTGQRFNDYIRQNVLRVAGMETALPDAPADSLTDRAFPSPYAEGDHLGLGARRIASRGWDAGGAGGGHASARDMFRFTRALLGGRLIDRALVDTLSTTWVPGGDPGYAYGFMNRQVNGRTVIGHSGGGPRGVAMCNDLDTFADGTWTVIVMSNYDSPLCSEIKTSITEMLARN